MISLTTIVVFLTLSYTLAVFASSRRRRTRKMDPPDDIFFVFMVPCLNEEVVIAKTCERLTSLSGNNYAVMIIDDGSEDRTAEIVRQYTSEKVWLFQRKLPEAQQGKGEALNAAYRYLRSSGVLGRRKEADVVTCILDADGRIAPNALFDVAPYFRDPKAGAVQIGVRMHNISGLLTRLQDFEFVTFTEVFQRGRQRVGSVGLGGNGQFTRLSALASLGDAPWTDCLTEDLDLGVRLAVKGWANHFTPTTWVSQQAVTDIRRLIRQRSRWFQGHMQCWKRIPMVLRSRLPRKAAFDLTYHLSSPALVLIFTFPILSFFLALIIVTIEAPGDFARALLEDHGRLLLFWYLLSFGLAPFYGFVYWLREDKKNFLSSLWVAHCFSLYSYLWFVAGWMAVGRVLTGKRGWAKTARTAEKEEDQLSSS